MASPPFRCLLKDSGLIWGGVSARVCFCPFLVYQCGRGTNLPDPSLLGVAIAASARLALGHRPFRQVMSWLFCWLALLLAAGLEAQLWSLPSSRPLSTYLFSSRCLNCADWTLARGEPLLYEKVGTLGPPASLFLFWGAAYSGRLRGFAAEARRGTGVYAEPGQKPGNGASEVHVFLQI